MSILKIALFSIGGIVLTVVGFLAGVYISNTKDLQLAAPSLLQPDTTRELPLLAYTIPSLRARVYQPSTVTIVDELSTTDEFTSYVFSYQTLDKKMSGQLNVPAQVTPQTPVIVMLRGYVPPAIFSTGVGTKNAAAVFAASGFITVAPDFFGYGDSDPEPEDSWQARFEKPISVAELIETVRQTGVPLNPESELLHTTSKIGIWGHSNGGQIAMSTLVALEEPIPTTLWAPVLAPFPYSVLYFSDEHDDEGRGMRIWLSQLEDEYELRDFSFTQYLDGLVGPLQIQHGTNDEAAPHIWSTEFVQKLELENKRRAQLTAELTADSIASESSGVLTPIEYDYITYPGADHNLQPNSNWQQAVEKDLEFFRKTLL